MKIIVIGSKGFIGSALRKHLIIQNYEVWSCDLGPNYADCRYFEISSPELDFPRIFEQQKFEVCVNCSGSANVQESISNPFKDFKLNSYNVTIILSAIKSHNPTCKFLNISSAAVYGNPTTLPIKENCLERPVSPYGFHKYFSEKICEEFYKIYNIRTCSLRIFSAYGPGLKKQLFWDLYKKAQKNLKINLFGNGSESRDFIYIIDILRAIECTLKKSPFNANKVNCAQGEEITISSAAHKFFEFFDKDINFQFSGEPRNGDPQNWCADISILRSYGFTPIFNFDNGIKEYISWLKEINF